jgi:hypothetical protein
MATWSPDEFAQISAAREIEISSPRADGTPRDPVTIWVVGVDDDLYIRSVKGAAGAWFRGAEARHEGHIEAGSVDRDVSFEEADHGLDEAIDNAYRGKYSGSPSSVETITSPAARATTLKLLPRL